MSNMENAMQENKALSQADAKKIAPRAEFRIFGQNIISKLEKTIWAAKASLYAVRDMPVETYFVSRKSNETNVKLRDNLLDIKIKTGETKEGFEIFQPSGKFAFPVKKQDVQAIMESLKVDGHFEKEECSLQEFMTLVANHPDLCAVEVAKKRYGFSVDGVICEYAEVLVNGAKIETACCESEDYEKIQSVIERLGMHEAPNTSYIKAIRKIVGM